VALSEARTFVRCLYPRGTWWVGLLVTASGITGAIAALAVMAALLVAPTVSAAGASTGHTASVIECPDTWIGYSVASLSTRNSSCRTGRRIVRRWVNTDFGPGPRPTVSYIRGWRCAFTRRYSMTLRCSRTRGAKAVKAVWGD
jgi:hypothetical protein